MSNNTFARNLNRIARLQGTTVSAILKDMGLSTSKVTLWNNGSLPKPEMMQMLAEKLNCEVADFFDESETSALEIRKEIKALQDRQEEIKRERKMPRENFEGTNAEYLEYMENLEMETENIYAKLIELKRSIGLVGAKRTTVMQPISADALERFNNVNKNDGLSDNEKELLNIFRTLNRAKQHKLMALVYEFADGEQ